LGGRERTGGKIVKRGARKRARLANGHNEIFFLLSYLFFYEFMNIYIALNVLQNHTYAAI
jgi:hypothetical protein